MNVYVIEICIWTSIFIRIRPESRLMEKFTDRASQKSPIPYFLSDRYISNQEYIKSYIFEEEHIQFYEF